MFKFVFVKVRGKHPRIENSLDYGWMLKINNFTSLILYEIESPQYVNAFRDFGDAWRNKSHEKNGLSAWIVTLCKLKGSSFVDELTFLSERACQAKYKILSKYGVIYINRNGGFFPAGEGVTEYSDVVESDKLLFPAEGERDIRFIQWPGGKHWYVKVDNLDVIVNGEQKWCDKKQAEEALDKWFKASRNPATGV